MLRVISLVLLCSWWAWCPSARADHSDLHQDVAQLNAAIFEEFRVAYTAAVQQVDRQFGIDYLALDRLYGARYQTYLTQHSLAEHLPASKTAPQQRRALEAFFQTPEALRYVEARLVLEHELEQHHLLRARHLQACEDFLEELIASDPLFHYFFYSSDYQRQHGLLLKRVAWNVPGGLLASTELLTSYTMFADRTRMPVLITLSHRAFDALPRVRSLLVHELEHVLCYKDPACAGTASHALQEYYACAAQLLYDDRLPDDPQGRLPREDRRFLEQLRDRAYEQLSAPQQAFVRAHPAPPLAAYIELLLPPRVAVHSDVAAGVQ